jgi:ProP effector
MRRTEIFLAGETKMGNYVADIKADIAKLIAAYPAVFHLLGAERRPLKIGIRDDLVAADIGLTGEAIGRAIGWYVRGPSYLKQVKAGAPRIGLNGGPAGSVTEEEEAHAAARLAEIKARWKRQRDGRQQEKKAKEKAKIEPTIIKTVKSNAPPSPPKRLSLRDLREAGRARRQFLKV